MSTLTADPDLKSIGAIGILAIIVLSVTLGLAVAAYPGVGTVGFFILLGALLSWWRPGPVIAFFALYIPVEQFLTFRLDDQAFILCRVASEAVLWVLLGATIVKRLTARRPLESTPIDIPIAAFLGIALLSAIVNGVGATSLVYGLRQIFRYAILVYIIANAGLPRRTMKAIMWAFLSAAAIQIAIGLIEALSGGAAKQVFISGRTFTVGSMKITRGGSLPTAAYETSTAIFGTLQHYNAYGVFLALALLTALGLRTHGFRFGGRKGATLFIAAGFVCLVLSYSRSSMLALIAGQAVCWHISGKKRAARAVLLGTALAFVVLFYVGTFMRSADIPIYDTNILMRWVRVFQPQQMGAEELENYRLFLLVVVATRVFAKSPLLGIGPGTFGSAISSWTGSTVYEDLGMRIGEGVSFVNDSNWASIFGQVGILGGGAFLILLAVMIRYCITTYRRTSDRMLKGLCLACVGSIVVMSISSFFGNHFEGRYSAYYLWMIFGAVVALSKGSGLPRGPGVIRRILTPARAVD
jgi:hypothetical protein